MVIKIIQIILLTTAIVFFIMDAYHVHHPKNIKWESLGCCCVVAVIALGLIE